VKIVPNDTGQNLHKYYDQLHVLKELIYTFKKGEIVSIVGASGAGKTTLLQILGTLDKPLLKAELSCASTMRIF
jgi:lipoprotein-releasing system ATP-binding protein